LIVAGNDGLAIQADFNARSARRFAHKPAKIEQPAKHARRRVYDKVFDVDEISEQFDRT